MVIDYLPAILAVLLVAFAVVAAWISIQIVPQSNVYVIERFGRYRRTLIAGLNFIIPILDRVAHRVSIIERQLPTFSISVITRDNVEVDLEATVFLLDASSRWTIADPSCIVNRTHQTAGSAL